MPSDQDSTLTPTAAVTSLRIIWGALIVGQVFLAGIVGTLAKPDEPWDAEIGRWLLYLSAGLVLLLAPLGYFVRNQTYKAGWRGDVITPGAYVRGNVALFAMMEGAAMVAMISALFSGDLLPSLLIAAAALVVQLINFPTGKPLEPTPPVFADGRS